MSIGILEDLEAVFKKHRNEENALKQKAYLRDHFPFIGLTKPLRSSLEKQIFKQYPVASEKELIALVYALWDKEEREFHYSAIELIIRYKKLLTLEFLPVLEHLIRTRAWWDSVDTLAAHILGAIVKKYPELQGTMLEWLQDPHLWIRRSALLYQLTWKEKTDEELLFNACQQLMHEKEFFIRKAIGWVLRQYSKTNPEAVKMFVEKTPALSPLSRKEASKYL